MPGEGPVQQVTIGRALAALMVRHEPIVLVDGVAGAGKTRGILSIMLARALRWAGSRILLARAKRKSLNETVLVTLEEQVFPAFGLQIPGGARRPNRSAYHLANGSVLVPLGADEGQRLYSSEWDFVYGAEAIEFTKNQVGQLSRAMRHFVAPVQQIVLDTNPGPPGHWLNQTAQDVSNQLRRVSSREDYERLQRHNYAPAPDPNNKWKRIIARFQDNPRYWDHSRWSWTPDGLKYFKESLGPLSGHLRERLVGGLWKAASGTVYSCFDEDVHACRPFRIPGHWPIFVAYDPGYDHPAAVLWFTVGENETLYVIDEIYEGGLSVPTLAQRIHDRNAGRTVRRYWGDPQHIYSETQQAPKSIRQQFKDCPHKISFDGWPRTAGNEDEMVQAVRTRIESGRFKVFNTCRNTIREFQSWSFKRTPAGELTAGEDQYEDRDNHTLDCIKGFIATGPKHDAGAGVVVKKSEPGKLGQAPRRRGGPQRKRVGGE